MNQKTDFSISEMRSMLHPEKWLEMDGVTCLDYHMMQCRGFPSGLILELITAFPIVPLKESALQVSTQADHILHERSKETDKSTDMTLQINEVNMAMSPKAIYGKNHKLPKLP